MDKGSIQTARQQYQKLFEISETVDKPTTVSSLEDRFTKLLAEAVMKIADFTLGDDEFDEILINTEEIVLYSAEELLQFINSKLKRLTELLPEEEKELEYFIDENEKIKSMLADKIKQTELLVGKLKEELEGVLKDNSQLSDQQAQSITRYAMSEEEISKKEDSILQLNKNIKQLMDQYLGQRNNNNLLEERVNKIKTYTNELRREYAEMEDGFQEGVKGMETRLHELTMLRKQHNALSSALSKNQRKMNDLGQYLDKKIENTDKYEADYSNMLEKDLILSKKLNEMEKEKEQLLEEIDKKNKESNFVRDLNKKYEDKLSHEMDLERICRYEEKVYSDLQIEREKLQTEIKEVAPHSVTVSPTKESLIEISKNLSLEKYSDLNSQDIARELEKLKRVAGNSANRVAYLEKNNNKLGETLANQRREINEANLEISQRTELLELVKGERDEGLDKCEKLGREMNNLVAKFGDLELLLENPGKSIHTPDYDEDKLKYKFSFHKEENLFGSEVPEKLKSSSEFEESPQPKKPSSSKKKII